jgi:hypothetical protein
MQHLHLALQALCRCWLTAGWEMYRAAVKVSSQLRHATSNLLFHNPVRPDPLAMQITKDT